MFEHRRVERRCGPEISSAPLTATWITLASKSRLSIGLGQQRPALISNTLDWSIPESVRGARTVATSGVQR